MSKFSSWREGAAARKDARQSVPDDSHKTRGMSAKRNTKRWCRGKVGVDHKPEVKTYAEVKNWKGIDGFASNLWHGQLVRYCSECGKDLEHYHPPWPSMPGSSFVAPDWAEAFFQAHPEHRPARVPKRALE